MAASTAGSMLVLREIDQFQAEFLGQDGQKRFFLDEALVDEDLVRRELGGGLDCLGSPGAIGVREQPTGGKRFEQLHGVLV